MMRDIASPMAPGLYLRLFVNGGSHGWRFDYSLNGRRNTLSLGTYPDTSLSLARKKADDEGNSRCTRAETRGST
jgi:Arm domain-containing DNA-binding protein